MSDFVGGIFELQREGETPFECAQGKLPESQPMGMRVLKFVLFDYSRKCWSSDLFRRG